MHPSVRQMVLQASDTRLSKAIARLTTVMDAPPTITQSTGSSSSITSATQYTAANAVFRYTGQPLSANPASLGSGWRAPTKNGGSSDFGMYWVQEWRSNASELEIRLLNYSTSVDVKVDGQPIRATKFTTSAAGSAERIKIDWTADASPTKSRLYRMEGYNHIFGGIWTNPGATVAYPTELDGRPLMAWMSDSYGVGSNGIVGRTVCPLVASILGYDNYHDAVGSMGWNSTGANIPATRFSDRIGYLAAAPTAIVTALGFNDSGGADFTTAFNTWADAALAKWPSAKYFILGPWTPVGSGANLNTVASRLSAAAAGKGMAFVPISDIVNAGNKATYTDADNTHPIQVGHQFLARNIAPLLSRAGA